MTDSDRLKVIIDKSQFSYEEIAEKLGVSPKMFEKKLENQTELNAKEIQCLCSLLNIENIGEREAIFFASDVEKIETTRLVII